MVQPMDPSALIRQADWLALDFAHLVPDIREQLEAIGRTVPRPVTHVYLVGCGDSLHAAVSATMAYSSVGQVKCSAVSARHFLDYEIESLQRSFGATLVVGASASGRTSVVAQALAASREKGAMTVALTGDVLGPVAAAAAHRVRLALPQLERSPGVRTYQATLLAMLMLAAEIGPAGTQVFAGLDSLGTAIDQTVAIVGEPSKAAAALVVQWKTLVVIGGGPNRGTAMFTAAKLAETAGVIAVAQEPEEWWHVERRFRPAGVPLLILAAPGNAARQSGAVLRAARQLGKPVILVAGLPVDEPAGTLIPVAAEVREELSPLLYHVFSAFLAAYVAQILGRKAFEGDPAGFPGSLEAFL